MKERLQGLRKAFYEYGIEALIVNNPRNCLYLSGFTGSAATLVIDEKNAFLLTDFRYLEQARQQSPSFKVIEVKRDFAFTLDNILSNEGIVKTGVESDYLTYQQFSRLNKKLERQVLVPTTGIVQKLREIKDPGEIENIQKSMQFLDRAFNHITGIIKPGMTERKIALELEFFARKEGAESQAFSFIVASGLRSSLPHGIATEKTIEKEDLVTIDFGVFYNNYASDMTRTVVIGKSNKKQEEIYNIVLKAQLTGLEHIKPGVKACNVDRAVRKVIEDHGYGEYFGHSTGHGVGLEVHESPRLSGKDETVLEEGMVVTVEPGIYIPDWGGVRIEDTVVVEENGFRILCNSTKDRLLCL